MLTVEEHEETLNRYSRAPQLAIMGVFTSWKLANTTNQGFRKYALWAFPEIQRKSVLLKPPKPSLFQRRSPTEMDSPRASTR